MTVDAPSSRRGRSLFESQGFHAHDKCLVKAERELDRTQAELDKTRALLHESQQKAKVARDTIVPLRRRVQQLESDLAKERALNDQLALDFRARESENESNTALLAERFRMQRAQAAKEWSDLESELRADKVAAAHEFESRLEQLESELRADMAAAAQEYESRLERLQSECDFLHKVAAKGGAAVVAQSVRRGSSIRREIEQKQASATRLQACVRGGQQRRENVKLREAAVSVQLALRRLRARRSLREAIATMQEQRLREVESVDAFATGQLNSMLGLRGR